MCTHICVLSMRSAQTYVTPMPHENGHGDMRAIHSKARNLCEALVGTLTYEPNRFVAISLVQ